MAKKQEEFKPCPFCGGVAELRKDGWGHWYIGCFNQSCAMHPKVILNEYVLKRDGSIAPKTMTYLIKDALKKWNRRV